MSAPAASPLAATVSASPNATQPGGPVRITLTLQNSSHDKVRVAPFSGRAEITILCGSTVVATARKRLSVVHVRSLGKALKSPRRRESEAELAQTGRLRFPGDCLRTRDDWVRAAALEALFAVAAWSDPSSPEPAGAFLAVLADERFDRHSEWQEALGEFQDRQRVADVLAKLDRAAQERAVAQLDRDLRGLGSPRSYEAALLMPRLRGRDGGRKVDPAGLPLRGRPQLI